MLKINLGAFFTFQYKFVLFYNSCYNLSILYLEPMNEITVIQNKIYEIRGQRVLPDFDLAQIYQVETKVLKQAVRRNIGRFPQDFMFETMNEEYNVLKISLRSQFVTLNKAKLVLIRLSNRSGVTST